MKIKNARQIDTSTDICNRKFLTKIIEVEDERGKDERGKDEGRVDEVDKYENILEVSRVVSSHGKTFRMTTTDYFNKNTIEPGIDNADIVAMYNDSKVLV